MERLGVWGSGSLDWIGWMVVGLDRPRSRLSTSSYDDDDAPPSQHHSSNRGIRHYWGVRVRGQHTKTTGRRGKTVGPAGGKK